MQQRLTEDRGQVSEPRRKVAFILGLGRSGTTFLAKLIDSSPKVLYRHEPDAVLPIEVPSLLNDHDLPSHLPTARIYVEKMIQCRESRVSCHLPIFRKSYRSRFANFVFPPLTMSSKLAQRYKLPVLPRLPDLIGSDDQDVTYLIKSVSSLGHARLLDAAMPGMTYIHILRHPCAVYASLMVGIEKGIMAPDVYLKSLFLLGETAGYPFCYDDISNATFEEQVAYRWMLLNGKAAKDMAAARGYLQIRYEDLCTNVEAVSREIFDHLGLDLQDQTRQFMSSISRDSNVSATSTSYFKINRPITSAVDKWKAQVEPASVERIRNIVAHSEIGRAYFAGH